MSTRNHLKQSVLFYVSGHGYGHSVRMAEIIRVLAELRPNVRIIVRTTAPRWLFQTHGEKSPDVLSASIDFGVMEDSSSLNIDVASSVKGLERFISDHETVVKTEVEWVKANAISLIIADIPYLAGDIGAAAGVSCIGVSNFLWDWIYEPLLSDDERASDFLRLMRHSYTKMEQILRLPFAHEMDYHPNVISVPLVTAIPTRTSQETRKALRISVDDNRPVVFLAMRAHLPQDTVNRAAIASPQFLFAAIGTHESDFPENVRNVLLGAGVSFSDVIAASDTVVSKPGYGMVAACTAHETNLLFPRRYGFREDDVLLAEAPCYMRIREIPRSDYKSGAWADHLQAIHNQPKAKQRPAINGADVCARIIVDHLERR
jgi:hypothetical protein